FLLGDKAVATFTGSVIDAITKQPVKKFEVKSEGLTPKLDDAKPGQFTVKIDPGREYPYSFAISAPGYPPQKPFQVQLSAGATQITREFPLGKGGGVKGRLVDKTTHQPRAGVKVIVAAGPELWNRSESKAQARSQTDESGAFQ